MRIKGPIENKWGGGLPPQQISSYKKNREWRLAHLKWADSKTFFNYSPVRNSVIHKKINYDLVNGKTHREDMELVLNPERVKEKFKKLMRGCLSEDWTLGCVAESGGRTWWFSGLPGLSLHVQAFPASCAYLLCRLSSAC